MADETRQQEQGQGLNRERHESRTGQTFASFLRDVCEQGGWKQDEAVRNTHAVLAHLRMRLTGDEAKDLEAQLPMKLVELLEDTPRPEATKPIEKLHKQDFVAAIANELGCPQEAAESAIRNVFAVVRKRISEGEANDVESQLPKDLKPLWARPV